MPELVANGVSGFLVMDEVEAVKAVRQLDTVNRYAVRAHAERFSAARMVEGYLHAYHSVLTNTRASIPVKESA
jgi:hypothetical protein